MALNKSKHMKHILIIIVILVLFAFAWLFKNKSNEQIQICEHCGESKIIISDEPQPRTIPWCFECGSFCKDGLNILIELEELPNPRIKDFFPLIEHCDQCFGCRAALYEDLEQWEESRSVWKAFQE